MTHTFERTEKKYLLTLAQYEQLSAAMQGRMIQDIYGLHTIGNLYLDTDDWAVIRASNAKPTYKEKLRLRAYGRPAPDSRAFLEIKKKVGGVVYKRRADLPYAKAAQYAARGRIANADTQILREIDCAMRRLAVSPKVCLCYDRRALTSANDPDLRVTFDDNIRFRLDDLDLTHGSWGVPLLTEPGVLMEVKALCSVPMWFAGLLSDLRIYPTSFSKVGICYTSFIAGGAFPGEGGLVHVS